MKVRSLIFALTAVVFTYNANASQAGSALDVQNIESLRQHVLNFTSDHYRASFGEEYFEKNVSINVGRIDSRLRLAECDDNLTFDLQEPPHSAKNITIKTICEGPRRWTVYVPATLEIYADVLVSTRFLGRGEIVSESDLTYRRLDIATAGHGHMMEIDRVAGMQVKRPIKIGATIKSNHLEAPEIVEKGQTVVVTSSSRFLSVETSAVALSSGQLGEQIKVKNERSNRVVSAQIVAPGRVIVANR